MSPYNGKAESGRILRDADEPVSTRDLVLRVMALRGLNAADKGMYDAMRGRVGASLRGLRERGRVTAEGTTVTGVKWGLAI